MKSIDVVCQRFVSSHAIDAATIVLHRCYQHQVCREHKETPDNSKVCCDFMDPTAPGGILAGDT